jgi:broad specificity phosphatase PhoE
MPDLILYLVRHGETEYNRRGLMQGQRIDAPLNRNGIAQARALGERFCPVALDAIYVSPLRRAMETARPVIDCHADVPLHVDGELAEMSWGELEGRSIDEVGDTLRFLAGRWKQGAFDDRVGGGESILDVASRARRALDRILERHAGGDTVLAVTHGRYLRVLLATALPEVGLERMDRFPHANTGVYRIVRDNGSNRLDLTNCTEHLEWMGDAA